MRFIHIADVHLGAVPDSDCPWSAIRGKEIWNTFQKVIQMVKEQKVELLLIAGDLFHRQPLVRELREVNYLFSMIPETQIVWMAGNHDYMKETSAYRKVEWAENVHGFFSECPGYIYLPTLQTWVYGLSYERREIKEDLYEKIAPNHQPGHHILLAHGGDAMHIPFKKEDFEGFDYVALGHIHKPGILVQGKAAYAGALEPLDRNDTGIHGLIYGEITDKVKFKFLPVACRSYLNLDVMIHSSTTQFGLEQKIKEAIDQKGEKNIYRVRIAGYRNPDMEFEKENIYHLGNVVEVQDETKPYYDLEKLKKQQEGTLIGEYIRCFDGKEEEVWKKALYYGLQALMETEL